MEDYLGSRIGKLGFGLMRLPMEGKAIDIPQVSAMTDLFLEHGYTYFDTAYIYNGGGSEIAAREALVRRHPRESFQLADKLPLWDVSSSDDLKKMFETSLKRAGVEYFDYYLLHNLSDERIERAEKTGAWEYLLRLKEQGLVRHIGFSSHDSAQNLDKILSSHPEAEFVQLQINYGDWESQIIQSKRCYEVARKHKKPVIIMEPVKGGTLATLPPKAEQLLKEARPDLSVASWAVRFAASLDGLITVLSGMSTLAQMRDNISIMDPFTPLDTQEREVLAQATKILNRASIVPCTNCKYCLPACPKNISIPDLMRLLNDNNMYGTTHLLRRSYRFVAGEGRRASDCLHCGACETRCPQRIKISDLMTQITSVFEV
jgi:predicted aldo/keto reductase-like oxidoreductase